MDYITDSIKKFAKLPQEVVLTIDSEEVAKKIIEINRRYKVKLFALLIFIATDSIDEENIIDYLMTEFGISETVAKKVFSEFTNKVLTPLEKRLNFLSDNVNKKASIIDEKSFILKMLSSALLSELKEPSVIIEAVNLRILKVLSLDLGFQKEMERALYKNIEKVTHKKFLLDGQEHAPSVRNWLKYFISQNGTDFFDNVLLSHFVSSSVNAKRLSEDEKKLLHKVISIYRNIKFFPESMPSDDSADWEIIPIDKKDVARPASQTERVVKTGREVLFDELKGNVDDYPKGSLEREVMEEESERDRERHKLLLLSKKYRPGSLERRAVEEELRKMEN